MKVNLKSGMTALLSLFGATVAEGAEAVEHDITPESLEEMNTRLSERNQIESDLQAERDAHQATRDELATSAARITELEAVVAQRPAVGTTAAVKAGDDKGHEDVKPKPSYVLAAEEALNRGKKK